MNQTPNSELRTPNRLRTYLSFVRFSHSVFALPFALTGALLAFHEAPLAARDLWWRVLFIVVAMVAARSAAMGFNRLADAEHDARNPRTAMRELPRGAMTKREAVAFVVIASVVFIGAAAMLGEACFLLSPVALAIVFWYSLAKRFTSYTQFFLALAMAVAPVGGWLAAGGRIDAAEPWLLGAAIGAWVGGFDILYACQDLEFDRAAGLKSIPVRFGVPRSLLISRAMHVVSRGVPGRRLPLSPISDRCISSASRWSPSSSSTSSRSSARTISRRSNARSISTATSAFCIFVTTAASAVCPLSP